LRPQILGSLRGYLPIQVHVSVPVLLAFASERIQVLESAVEVVLDPHHHPVVVVLFVGSAAAANSCHDPCL
jgi:hypothetical protein